LYYLKSMQQWSEKDPRSRLPCIVMYLSGASFDSYLHACN
jgi:hypothetical protein